MTMARLRKWMHRFSTGLLFALSVMLFLAVVLWDRVVITVPAGSAAVMWYRFFGGTAVERQAPLREGLHLIFPWDRIFVYEVRLQSKDEDYNVVSSDGLHFKVTLTFRWEPIRENLGLLHSQVGPDYPQRLLVPEIGSVTRHAISAYTADEMISRRRDDIQRKIFSEAVVSGLRHTGKDPSDDRDDRSFVHLRSVLIKEVVLPEQIRVAIQNKLEQAQIVEEYGFRVTRERLESERKAVEAEGIRRFQETVAPAITESYLRWRGIEATLQLSQSPNSKVVVIGSSGGLPIILDGVDRRTDSTPPTAPGVVTPTPPTSLPGAGAEPVRPNLPAPDRMPAVNVR